MTKRESKSPIKNLPVRQPGQSTREKFAGLFDEEIMPYFLAVAAMVLMTFWEWWRYLFTAPPHPWVITIIAVIAILILIRKIQKTIPLARQLKLGAVGEEAVGQFLDEKLRPMGCQVFHDILGDSFNVDHLVVGPTGVFAVETKTHSKPVKGMCNVKYDGEKVTVNGATPERDPIVQAKAEAKWVSDLLEQSTGRRFFVQPIVLYPGWYVETTKPNVDVWVLNDQGMPTFIRNARNHQLSPEDISLISFHLKRYVISRDQQAKLGQIACYLIPKNHANRPYMRPQRHLFPGNSSTPMVGIQ